MLKDKKIILPLLLILSLAVLAGSVMARRGGSSRGSRSGFSRGSRSGFSRGARSGFSRGARSGLHRRSSGRRGSARTFTRGRVGSEGGATLSTPSRTRFNRGSSHRGSRLSRRGGLNRGSRLYRHKGTYRGSRLGRRSRLYRKSGSRYYGRSRRYYRKTPYYSRGYRYGRHYGRRHYRHGFYFYIGIPYGYYSYGYPYSRYYYYGEPYPRYYYPNRSYTYSPSYYYYDDKDSDDKKYQPDKADQSDEPVETEKTDPYVEKVANAFAAGDYVRAVGLSKQAIAAEPESFVLPFIHSQSLFAAGRYNDSAYELRKALDKAGTERKGVYFSPGLYPDKSVLDSQIAELKTAADSDLYNYDLQLLLGYQLLGVEKYDQAMNALEQAEKDSRNRAPARLLIAVLEQSRTGSKSGNP